jgi:5-methylcytosine-specific restriction enzyme A
MPTAPLHPCATPSCGALLPRGTSHCVRHAPQGHSWDVRRQTPITRVTGRKLQAKRLELFAREPFCRTCAQQGRKRLATIRDHIVSLAEGGTEDESNIAPLCQACSDAKTHAESMRARR